MTASISDAPQPPTHTVIEALYDLPLGGSWAELQQALCAFWADAGEAPETGDIHLLERHFQRALAFLERLPSQPSSWRNALYRMPVPAAVFTPQAELVDANPSGRRILGCTEHDLAPLPEAHRRVLRHGMQQLPERPLSAISLPTASGELLRLFISTLPSTIGNETPLYVAVIVSNELPSDARSLLIEQYGLTPSEAKVCLHLSSGASLDEAASKMGVKKNTVRTHLASSFAKLAVSSQAELVSMVLHSVFAATQLMLDPPDAPRLTPYLDPELHGYPKFSKVPLDSGRVLGFFEYGDPEGIPALYLHGSLDCGLLAKTQRLNGTGIRLIAVERPGVGESTFHRDVSPGTYAADLIRLADTLGLASYAVIGRSMGSWDAVALCLADPRVRLLTLVSGRLPFTGREQISVQQPIYRALYNSIWHSATMGRLILRAMQLQLMVKGARQFMPEAGLPDTELALVRDNSYQRHMKAVWLRCALGGADATYAQMRLYQQPIENPPWQGFVTPTLLVHGEVDQDVPLEQLLEQTSTFADREVIILPNLAHRVAHCAMGEVLRQVATTWRDRQL